MDHAVAEVDADGDLVVVRKQFGRIEIEHMQSTNLQLVGLQVWRGAFVLADFIFHNRHRFIDKRILELGAGTGLSSIAAAVCTEKPIVCTDIDVGGILSLLRSNIKRNIDLTANVNKIEVMELDFNNTDWPVDLRDALTQTDIVIAADGECLLIQIYNE